MNKLRALFRSLVRRHQREMRRTLRVEFLELRTLMARDVDSWRNNPLVDAADNQTPAPNDSTPIIVSGTRLASANTDALQGLTANNVAATVNEDSLNNFIDVLPTVPVDPTKPWQNPRNRFDVNADGHVSPIDVLLIINQLNRVGPHKLTSPPDAPPPPYVDVSGDNFVTAQDALQVINQLNSALAGLSAFPQTPFVTAVTQGSHGAVRFTAAGVWYTPTRDFFGTDEFTYTMSDGSGNTTTATVSVTVNPINDPPVNGFPRVVQRTLEDTAMTFSSARGNAFYVSDIDAVGEELQVVFTATGGTLSLVNAAGVTVASGGATIAITGSQSSINMALGAGLTFNPASDFSGRATLAISTTDQGGLGANNLVNITVAAVNDAPVNTLPANLLTGKGAALTVNTISLRDVDAGSGVVQTTLSVTPGSGTLRLLNSAGVAVTNNNGAWIRISGRVAAINTALGRGVRFTPATGFDGPTTLTMVSSDRGNTGAGGARNDTDSVTLQVGALVRPLAINDTFSVAEDSAASLFNVLANDTANPGAILMLKSFTQPLGGVVTQQGNSLQFAPAADFAGTTSFTYSINDSLAGQAGGGADSLATVTVTVSEINDPPTAKLDTLMAASTAPTNFTSAQLLANDIKGPTNEAGQTLRITSVSPTSTLGGTVSLNATTGVVTYTPPGGVIAAPPTGGNGLADSFTYVVSDDGTTAGIAAHKTATGTVNVTLSNGPPVNNTRGNVSIDEGVALTFSTANGNALSVTYPGGGGTPFNLKLSVNHGGTLNLASTAGLVVTGNVTQSLDITGSLTSINQALGSGLTFTPTPTFIGTTTVTMISNDQGAGGGAPQSDTDTFTIDVVPTVRPRAANDTAQVVEGSPAGVVINVLQNDRPNTGAQPTLLSFTQPAAGTGTVTRNDNGTPANTTDDTLTFVAPAQFAGAATFTYTINDTLPAGENKGADSTATVVVTVTEVNDPPLAFPDAVTAARNTPTDYSSAQLIVNDSPGNFFEASQTLRITSVSPTSTLGGTVSLNTTTGVVTYTPPGGVIAAPLTAAVNQVDSFTYVVSDDGTTAGNADPLTAIGTVNVSILTPVNFIPMTVTGSVYVDTNGNGVKDINEVGIGGVAVTISGTDFNGQAIASLTVKTDRNGFYSFSDLAPGLYNIRERQPANMADGDELVGANHVTLGDNDEFVFDMSLADNLNLQSHTFDSNNFLEIGLTAPFAGLGIWDLLASGPGQFPAGVNFSTDGGANDWYAFTGGWDGFTLANCTLSLDESFVTLRVTDLAAQVVREVVIPTSSGRVRFRHDGGALVVRVVGTPADIFGILG